ncbi:MAG: hypothetical protein J6M18_01215 [Actinomycetaceae bacterium]|nr:hypothetical protein [Actinomycetaceae bacterium]
MIQAIFIGMPGCGKTTVGSIVARLLKCDFADTDTLIEEYAGKSIPEIFAEDGEEYFRDLEAHVIADAVKNREGVLSLGGGAVLSEKVRSVLSEQPVFFINASDEQIMSRLERSTNERPLLSENPEEKVARLRKERQHLYEECAKWTVSSDSRPARRVARMVVALLGSSVPELIKMESYDILRGNNLDVHIQLAVQKFENILFISDHSWQSDRLRSLLDDEHHIVDMYVDDYIGNTAEVISFLENKAIAKNFVVVCVGGTQTVQFGTAISSMWLGGLSSVIVPTKVDTIICRTWNNPLYAPLAHGKIKVLEVICDNDLIDIPEYKEKRLAIAEAISLGYAYNKKIFLLLEKLKNEEKMHELIAEVLRVASLASQMRVRGEMYGYGHTFARAMKRLVPKIDHGYALSLGLVFSAAISESLNISPAHWTAQHRDRLESFGFNTHIGNVSKEDVIASLEYVCALYAPDDKMSHRNIRMMILRDYEDPHIMYDIEGYPMRQALASLGL